MNPDLNSISTTTANQRLGDQTLLGTQAAQSNDFLNRFKTAIGGQETSAAMASRIGGELGLPTLQKNAQNLQQSVYDIPSTYRTGLTGYNVNQNQLDRVVNTQTAKLAPIAQRAQDQANNAQTSLNTQMGYAQADENKALLPFQTEQQLLQDRQAREVTLYSQDNQNELSGLIAKINAGVTLSEGEKNRANQLAISEKQYEAAKSNPQANNTQIVDVGGKKYLIDSTTGKIISTYGSGSGGSTSLSPYFPPPSNTNSLGLNSSISSTVGY